MDYPIHVLCVVSTLDRGGAETMIMNLFKEIDRNLVIFDFVKHTDKEGEYEKEILALGGKIFRAPRYKIYNTIQYNSWWSNHLKNHPEHQIVHGHFFTISAVYFKTAKRLNRITIGHSHATPREMSTVYGKMKQIIENYLISRIEKYADYCMACSNEAGKWLFPNKPFVVLKNAIDINKYVYQPNVGMEVRKELGLGESFVLGAIGTIKEVKNPYGIIAILNEVLKEIPDTRLLWVGNDGGLKKAVEIKLGEMNISKQVVFTGVRADVNRLLQAMDVFIMPSLNEGIPLAGIEAQAAGIPCLFSNSISRDVAITDLCSFLPLSDLTAWKKSIIKAHGEKRKDEREKLVAAGYDVHITAAWLQDFYSKML